MRDAAATRAELDARCAVKLSGMVELLQCPRTGGLLVVDGNGLYSPQADAHYPIVWGAVDMRAFDPPYFSAAEDRRRAESLGADYAALSFEALFRKYASFSRDTTEELRACHIQRALHAKARGLERLAAMDQLAQRRGLALPREGVALELGSGTGGLAAALASRYSCVISVDIVLAFHVLQQKLFEEAGIENVASICAASERLPLRPQTVSIGTATDVIEHVREPRRMLTEVRRVLGAGGQFWFNSPNRFGSCREPHVGVCGASYLPRRLAPLWVWMWKRIPYHNIRLLSRRELESLLRAVFPGKHHIFRLSERLAGEGSSTLGRLYRRLLRTRVPQFVHRMVDARQAWFEVVAFGQ